MVHSISYGNDESQQSSVQYMYQVNVALQKLGVRGLTVYLLQAMVVCLEDVEVIDDFILDFQLQVHM